MQFYSPHPLGVMPYGNRPADDDERRRRGLGAALTRLPAAVRAATFEFLDVPDLVRLGACSSALYVVLAAPVDLWKERVADMLQSDAASAANARGLVFEGTWRRSAIRLYCVTHGRSFAGCVQPDFDVPAFPGRLWYDDELFQSWLCTLMPPDYRGALWKRGARQFRTVPKRSGLTPDAFRAEFEEPNLPVVLTDVATAWPMFKRLDGNFASIGDNANAFLRQGKEHLFRCESVEATLPDYVRYAKQQRDERPAYLFDPSFDDALRPGQWAVPEHFARDDLFSVLGSARPQYRWLIVGPARGGSSFHVDPNFTNAWNACLTGRKRWILFPPHVVPPGVHPSPDMSDVATPVSLTEWLLNFYDEALTKHAHEGYEVVCEAGETMFVPCGWWHSVVNLEDSVAVTQNYVSACNLSKVLKFLHAMPKSISGVGEDDADDAGALQQRRRDFYTVFATEVRQQRPDLAPIVDGVASDLTAAHERAQKRHRAVEDLVLPPASSHRAEGGGEVTAGFTFDF